MLDLYYNSIRNYTILTNFFEIKVKSEGLHRAVIEKITPPILNLHKEDIKRQEQVITNNWKGKMHITSIDLILKEKSLIFTKKKSLIKVILFAESYIDKKLIQSELLWMKKLLGIPKDLEPTKRNNTLLNAVCTMYEFDWFNLKKKRLFKKD